MKTIDQIFEDGLSEIKNKKPKQNLRSRSGKNITCGSGYGVVFNRWSNDLGGFIEQIDPHAFDDADMRDTVVLFNHDYSKILGRTAAGTASLNIDRHGLRYEWEQPETTYAKDLQQSMKRGDVVGSSFGFTIEDDEWTRRKDGTVERTITKISRLMDVSPVTMPAYPQTIKKTSKKSMRSDNQSQAQKLDNIFDNINLKKGYRTMSNKKEKLPADVMRKLCNGNLSSETKVQIATKHRKEVSEQAFRAMRAIACTSGVGNRRVCGETPELDE